jgi:hypothetical protein
MRESGSTVVADIIEIELPNRVKLRVGAGVEDAALRRVLAMTRQLP